VAVSNVSFLEGIGSLLCLRYQESATQVPNQLRIVGCQGTSR